MHPHACTASMTGMEARVCSSRMGWQAMSVDTQGFVEVGMLIQCFLDSALVGRGATGSAGTGQKIRCSPDVAWDGLVGAGIPYRSRLVFIVHNLLDASLDEELGALIAREHRHIHLLQQHSMTQLKHFGDSAEHLQKRH